MTNKASRGDAGSTARGTSGWQLALVALALAAFCVFVLLPLDLFVFFATVLLGLGGAMEFLDRAGALTPSAFGGAVYLGGAILLLGLLWVALVSASNLLRRLSPEEQKPPSSFPLRWPWWWFGLLLLLSCRLFLSLGSLPGVAGALVLATDVWAVLSVLYLLFRFSVGGLSLSWRIARVSPFGAGLLTVGALGCVGVMLTLSAVMEQLASRVSSLPTPQRDPTCYASTLECARRSFLAANASQPPAFSAGSQRPSLAAAEVSPASWSYPEASSGGSLDSESERSRRLRECLDSQYKNRDMLERAWRIAAARVGTEDAADIVHTVLISVCLNAETYLDFERFFLRSIENGTNSWLRRPGNVRTCSIDLVPEPVCELDPDDAYVRGETQLVVRDVLCSLDEVDRQVLVMRHYDELDEREIARRLGIGYDATRKRLQRARERFMAEFRQRCQ